MFSSVLQTLAAAAILWLTLAGVGCAAPDHAWVEMTDRGAEARLVTSAPACPDIVLNGAEAPMQRRAAPSADFPVTVCQALLPKDARSAWGGGRALPLPHAAPRRLVIFGDTGCRLKGKAVQDCDDPGQWPFAVVARLAAAHHPDVVIHVGDYYYR